MKVLPRDPLKNSDPGRKMATKDEEFNNLILAALLHDIGRFKKRAKKDGRPHYEIGADWLRGVGVSEEVARLVRKHHQEGSLISQADNVVNDGKEIEEEGDYFGPLAPVFSKIKLSEGGQTSKAYYYPLKEITDQANYPLENLPALNSKEYQRLWNSFEGEFSLIKDDLDSERLLILLEKYTSFIPDSAENPDIPLFDHLKMVAAIAACLKLAEGKEMPFLLVGGDFSGVQKFVYTISSKGALKTLRGRSLFLELLTEHIIHKVLNEFGLSKANLLWSGGARFNLLLPNNKVVETGLKRIRQGVNIYLADEHEARLYLVLEWQPFNSFSQFSDASKMLANKIGEVKRHKFLALEKDENHKEGREFKKDFGQLLAPEEPKLKECTVCHKGTDKLTPKLIVDEKVEMCEFCGSALDLGAKLPKLLPPNFFVEQVVDEQDKGRFDCKYDLTKNRSSNAKIRWVVNSWNLKDYNPGEGQMLLANYGVDMDFDEMSKSAKGSNDIGALRMDVDSLGNIFIKGLGEETNLLRVATLSRQLTYFFKIHINNICEGKSIAIVYSGGDDLFIAGAWSDIAELAYNIREEFKKFTCWNEDVNISGGFTVQGPKYPLYHFAELTREGEDKAKSNQDENGRKDSIALFYKTPILVDKPGEVKPKYALKWDDSNVLSAMKVKELKEDFVNVLGDEKPKAYLDLKVGRRLLFKLFDVVERRKDEGKLYLPLLNYVLTRCKGSLAEDVDRKEWDRLEHKLLSLETISYLQPALIWLKMLTRKEEG